MKKILITALMLIITALMPVSRAGAEDMPGERISISADMSKAPAGSAYIDILGRISPDSSYYTSFNPDGAPYVQTSINGDMTVSVSKDSPIAAYNEDGYMSLSLHYKGTSGMTVAAKNGEFAEGEFVIAIDAADKEIQSINDLYKKFGRFKAAYISSDGNILGVTDVAVSTLTNEEMHAMKLSGSNAVYELHSKSADNAKRLQDPVGLLSMGVYVMFLIMLVALGVIVIRNIWRFIKQMRKK
ncbi:MAG: hypothetical protein ILP19_01510 [Oscillospiraceae bacterium]|nr:hypothetical protein [Oscillospiraceae bacterium]